MSLRETIAAARDLREVVETVPEWGADVLLVEMDGEARMAFDDESAAIKESGKKESALHLAARLLAHCLHDPTTRAPVFAEGGADVLMKKHPKVLMRLFGIAAGLNVATEKEVNAAAGKSEGVPSAG